VCRSARSRRCGCPIASVAQEPAGTGGSQERAGEDQVVCKLNICPALSAGAKSRAEHTAAADPLPALLGELLAISGGGGTWAGSTAQPSIPPTAVESLVQLMTGQRLYGRNCGPNQFNDRYVDDLVRCSAPQPHFPLALLALPWPSARITESNASLWGSPGSPPHMTPATRALLGVAPLAGRLPGSHAGTSYVTVPASLPMPASKQDHCCFLHDKCHEQPEQQAQYKYCSLGHPTFDAFLQNFGVWFVPCSLALPPALPSWRGPTGPPQLWFCGCLPCATSRWLLFFSLSCCHEGVLVRAALDRR
jgi:hypothetical protein